MVGKENNKCFPLTEQVLVEVGRLRELDELLGDQGQVAHVASVCASLPNDLALVLLGRLDNVLDKMRVFDQLHRRRRKKMRRHVSTSCAYHCSEFP